MAFQSDTSLKLMDRVRMALAYYRYADRTSQSYCRWIREYVAFLGRKKVPKEQFQKEIDPFLSFLKRERNLSDASCRQALNALIFLYKRVFDVSLPVRPEPSKKRQDPPLPVVMTRAEVKRVLSFLSGRHLLMARLLYGVGLRLMECLRLKINDLDFQRKVITIRGTGPDNIRCVMMPDLIFTDLLDQVAQVRQIFEQDHRNAGIKTGALDDGKSDSSLTGQASGQFVFPAGKRTQSFQKDGQFRCHVAESGLQKAVKTAVLKAGIEKRVTCSTFRHTFAIHLLEKNVTLYTVKELLGLKDIKAIDVYIRVMETEASPVISPLDQL